MPSSTLKTEMAGFSKRWYFNMQYVNG